MLYVRLGRGSRLYDIAFCTLTLVVSYDMIAIPATCTWILYFMANLVKKLPSAKHPRPNATKLPIQKKPQPLPYVLTISEARSRLTAVVSRAEKGTTTAIRRWNELLYRIGPTLILTPAERERAKKKTVSELRDDFATSCSRMAQTLRPILITRNNTPVAALWRTQEAVEAEHELAGVVRFREQVDKALDAHRRLLTNDMTVAMNDLLKSAVPEIIRRVSTPIILKTLKEKLEFLEDSVAEEIADRILEEIVVSDRLRDTITQIAARLED